MIRHRGVYAVVVVNILLGYLSPALGSSSGPGVVPTPREWQQTFSSFKITSQTRIILGKGTTAADEFATTFINEELKTMRDAPLRILAEQSIRRLSENFIYIGTPFSETGRSLLQKRAVRVLPAMKAEGYWLDVDSERVAILAETERGRFYGVMSLLQLMTRERRSVRVKGVSIRDWPQMNVRGISDDISRGQISTVENFKKIIRFLARYKLNTYCLYLEDVFAFTRHPNIGRGRGALSAQEVKELDRFARKHHVELVPIFQTLGHWENILSLPSYASLAEFPGAHTLNLADERIYVLLDELIREVAQAFSSPFFHIGADETADVGHGGSKQLVAKDGLPLTLLNHYKRIVALVRKQKKKPMMYGDMLLQNPDILYRLPKDITVVDWQYDALLDFPSVRVFRQAKVPCIVSPSIRNYTGPFPDYAGAIVNIRGLAEHGVRNGALGMLTSGWNDFGGEALRELNYYGYAWTAECAWAQNPAATSEFDSAFFTDFFGNEEAVRPAQLVFSLLSANRVVWHELWRHPMLPSGSPSSLMTRVQNIQSALPLVQDLLSGLRSRAVNHPEQIEYLQFVADLTLWFARKAETAERLRVLGGDSVSTRTDSLFRNGIRLCSDVVGQLDSLKARYRTLWLRTNRPEGLDLLLQRYDRQKAYWIEKRGELEQSIMWSEPTLASQWIFHPDASPFTSDTTAPQVPHATFQKEVFLSSTPRRATIQLVALTHGRLSINDSSVGEVSARPSLSLIVENQRILFRDVTTTLRSGRNIITVEAHAYYPGESAGVNVCGEVVVGDSIITIQSDESWTVRTTDNGRNGQWQGALARPSPIIISRPDFRSGRASWIER